MIEFSVNNLTKYYAANKIFEQISFDVKTGERVGLIGQNGCGKTTLLKILMGTEDYQGGEVNIRKNARLGCLDQIPVYDDTVRTIDVMESAFEGTYEIKRQMRLLEERMKQPENDGLEKALRAYGKLAEQYEQSGGYELETRIGRVAAGLQITDSLKERTFNRLSGGERTRVMLAKLLLEEPDVLLLDEPTNHLDLETIQWLEGFLREYKGTVLVISHDRYFLDNVTGKIIEMEFDRANIYQGNYSYYTVEKERRFLIDYRNYVNQQKKIDRMERQIQRYRIWGEMRDSEKMFKKAKELEKRLEKMGTPEKPVLENQKIRLHQAEAERSGKIVLELENISKSFGNKPLLEDVNLTVFYGDSVCIMGRNGAGKTTTIKLILDLFFKTRAGFLLRAAGDNPQVVTALARDKGQVKILGLMIANALVALSGAILAQEQRMFEISMGTGAAVLSLASVILGVNLLGKLEKMSLTFKVIIGAILYKISVTFAIACGLKPGDLKLITSLLFLFILAAGLKRKGGKRHAGP